MWILPKYGPEQVISDNLNPARVAAPKQLATAPFYASELDIGRARVDESWILLSYDWGLRDRKFGHTIDSDNRDNWAAYLIR